MSHLYSNFPTLKVAAQKPSKKDYLEEEREMFYEKMYV